MTSLSSRYCVDIIIYLITLIEDFLLKPVNN